MHINWNISHPAMKRLLRVGLFGSLLSIIAVPCRADLSTRIRDVANHYDASTTRTPVATYYAIFAYGAPQGYRTTITLVEPRAGTNTVTVAIYERVADEHHVRLLVDDQADGTLEYVFHTRSNTLDAALRMLRSGNASALAPNAADRATYATLCGALEERSSF
jgi:hypothetical protein